MGVTLDQVLARYQLTPRTHSPHKEINEEIRSTFHDLIFFIDDHLWGIQPKRISLDYGRQFYS